MAKIKKHEYGEELYILFFCEACDSVHQIRINNGKTTNGWTWDGNADMPTFMPSVKTTYTGRDVGHPDAPPACCHLFVTKGIVKYCADCTHAMAGKDVPLEHIPPEWLG